MNFTHRLLTYICEHIEQHGRAPTIRQVAHHFDCSTSTAHDIISALTRQGLLEQAGTTRTLTLTQDGLIYLQRI
jgi:DNA-binding IclR family transcriptional regulator